MRKQQQEINYWDLEKGEYHLSSAEVDITPMKAAYGIKVKDPAKRGAILGFIACLALGIFNFVTYVTQWTTYSNQWAFWFTVGMFAIYTLLRIGDIPKDAPAYEGNLDWLQIMSMFIGATLLCDLIFETFWVYSLVAMVFKLEANLYLSIIINTLGIVILLIAYHLYLVLVSYKRLATLGPAGQMKTRNLYRQRNASWWIILTYFA
jgi:hypothetical protein